MELDPPHIYAISSGLRWEEEVSNIHFSASLENWIEITISKM